MLLCIVLRINLVKDLPSNVELNPLAYHLQLIPVLILKVGGLLEVLRIVLIQLHVQIVLGLLHLLIEYTVVLVANLLVEFLILDRH